MTVSVLIPTYNGLRTIRATLDSVLQQTHAADEILVMDDGSTDGTVPFLRFYEPRVTVFQQANRGVAAARNALCARATGDLIAFLDHDDVWHPRYLEHQCRQFAGHPGAVGFFAGVVNFYGYGNYEWKASPFEPAAAIEVLDPLQFFKRLGTASGRFVSPSLLCVPKTVLGKIGREPFCEKLSGVDDCYLTRRLALLGDVVVAAEPLVAYRITEGAQSENKLHGCRLMIECCETLKEHYRLRGGGRLYKAFSIAFASERRQYAKRLMGAGITPEARRQIFLSLSITKNPASLAKSLGFLLISYLPAELHPRWPSPRREWPTDDGIKAPPHESRDDKPAERSC